MERDRKLKKELKLQKKRAKTPQVYTLDDEHRVKLFYDKTTKWKRKREDKKFEKKIKNLQKQFDQQKKLKGYFKPRLNRSANKRNIITESFRQRQKKFLKKKKRKLRDVKKRLYDFPFQPVLKKRD